jgi:hypothetical protein
MSGSIESDIMNCDCGNEILTTIKTDDSIEDPWTFDVEIKPMEKPKICCMAKIGHGVMMTEIGVQKMATSMGVTVIVGVELNETNYE